jgi:hypothetical protein
METPFPRGDHIVPSFEEIWPSKAPTQRVKRGVEYYLDVSMGEEGAITGFKTFRRLRTTV